MISWLSRSLFRCHVLGCAGNDSCLRQMGVVLGRPHEAKIENLDSARVFFQPDIRGLDIAMRHSVLVGERETFGDLAPNPEYILNGLWNRSVPLPLAHESAFQRFTFEQRHRQKGN